MGKLTKEFSINTFWLVSYILLYSLLVAQNVYSRKQWNRNFTKVTYDPDENSISFRFVVYDYYFGPRYETAYLKLCDFYYTFNGRRYFHLMRAETQDQIINEWTVLKMKYKRFGTDLQFSGCFVPPNASMWPDDKDVIVEVKNDIGGQISFKINDNNKIVIFKYIAFFTVKWFLGEQYKDVKRIRLNGYWKVNGLNQHDDIDNVYYEISKRKLLKSTGNLSVNNRMKVATKADAIVITGAGVGENIKVYNLTGVEIQSTVANCDVVNINVPKNQTYIVTVGQAHYKVAMCVP